MALARVPVRVLTWASLGRGSCSFNQRQAMESRLNDLVQFYALLERLEDRCGGRRCLSDCNGRMRWPQRGVYFFMDSGEQRRDSGRGLRVTRVGTHALSTSSRTTLWNRLSQHRGLRVSGGGNHRGSIFRLLVGSALIEAGRVQCPTWGVGANAPREIREAEAPVEAMVTTIIGAMPLVWLAIDDSPGPTSLRAYVERNSIALLSNMQLPTLDDASAGWLGRSCRRGKGRVCQSGLWNQNHVEETYDPAFLQTFAKLIDRAVG